MGKKRREWPMAVLTWAICLFLLAAVVYAVLLVAALAAGQLDW